MGNMWLYFSIQYTQMVSPDKFNFLDNGAYLLHKVTLIKFFCKVTSS